MISFVVIGKNESWRLEKCLTAIRRMASSELKQPYEIIYVDSQSTDGSLELAKRYVDKVFLITGECNPAIGRNIGAKESVGDTLFFLDGDMELREGVLSGILKEDSLKYPIIEGVDNNVLFDNEWKKIEEKPRSLYKEGTEWNENSPSGGMFVIEKKVWEEVGGMDNRYVRCEDFEFGFRACETGYKTRRIGQLWVNHYTRYYALRSDSLTVYKYQAMLIRHFFLKKSAFMTLLWRNYSFYMLAISLLFFLLTTNLWVFVPYVLSIVYRTVKIMQRGPSGLNWGVTACKRFATDIYLIYYFCTFYPKQPHVSYCRVK